MDKVEHPPKWNNNPALQGWQRVVGIAIVAVVVTTIAIVTGSAEGAVVVVQPLISLLR